MRGPGVYVFVFALTLLALVAVSGSAQAQEPGSDNPIAFVRKNPALGDSQTYIINPPDGSHEHLLHPSAGEVPRWSPDGNKIALAWFLPQNGTPDIYTKTAEGTDASSPPRRPMTISQTES
jgi:Tol biopolymer transport system component